MKSRSRQSTLKAKVLLSFVTVIVVLMVGEVAFRLYYRFAGIPTTITFGSTSDKWRQHWIRRHLKDGIEVYYGYDVYHPLFGWALKPNLTAYQYKNHPPVTSNAHGWRSTRQFTYDKPEGIARVVVLGDSFTFGEQARDDETWPACLEQQLDNTEVLNLAIHGYGTDQQLRVLEVQGVKYQPDIVVLGFFVEDIFRNGLAFRDFAKPMYILEDAKLVLTNSPVPRPQQILAQSEGARPLSYMVHFVSHRLAGRYPPSNLNDVLEKRDLFLVTRAILKRMHEVTTDAQAKLLVVIIPTSLSGSKSSPLAAPSQPWLSIELAVEQWAGEIGYAVVNLRPSLAEARQEHGRPVYNDFYHSAFGELVAATVVRRKLTELGWVAQPSRQTIDRLERRFEQIIAATSPLPSN